MRFAYLIPILLFAGLAAVFGVRLTSAPEAPSSPFLGHPMPPLSLAAFGAGEDAAPVTSAVFADASVSVVNFWASWCTPCHAEHPQMIALSGIPGVQMIGINYKDKTEQAQRMLDKLGNPYDIVAADPKGRTGIDWGITGVPETFIVDGNGVLLLRYAGPLSEAVLKDEILPVVRDALAP